MLDFSEQDNRANPIFFEIGVRNKRIRLKKHGGFRWIHRRKVNMFFLSIVLEIS